MGFGAGEGLIAGVVPENPGRRDAMDGFFGFSGLNVP